jgi:type II secretory pathway pseudopilin PulG
MRRRPENLRHFRGCATAARAFTLVESTMAVLIVSGVLVASLGTFGAIGRSRQVQVERAEAFGVAERIMAEVLQCRFQEAVGVTTLGPDAGETVRTAFDDVDDYDNWQTSPPVGRDGVALAGYGGWKVKVKVRHVLVTDPNSDTGVVTGLKRITVAVSTPGGIQNKMVALRSDAGAYEQVPAATTNYLTWGGVAVKVGERGRTVYGGAHPLNVTTSQ